MITPRPCASTERARPADPKSIATCLRALSAHAGRLPDDQFAFWREHAGLQFGGRYQHESGWLQL